MEFIITFFRDILDGPLYIVVAVISVILICSCIGYLAETSLNKKKAKQEYDDSHADLSNNQNIVQTTEAVMENPIPVEVSNSVSNNLQTDTISSNSVISENMQQASNPAVVQNPSINAVQQPIPELNLQQNIGIPETMGTPTVPPSVTTPPQAITTPPSSIDQIPKV